MLQDFLHNLDKEIFLSLNSNRSSLADTLMFSFRDLFLWTLVTILLIFLYRNFKKSEGRSNGMVKLILVSFLIAFQVTLCLLVLPYIFSFFVHVERPVYNEEFSQISGFSNFDYASREGFFAGKTCAVAALAVFFIVYYETPKWFKVMLFLWILLIAYNRIYTGAYYPSSLILSILVGGAIGHYSYKYYNYLRTSVLVI